VTVPIKISALIKGLQTGWRDLHYKHDNSWWESFGGAKTQQWVQIWLLSVNGTMLLSLVAGLARLIMAALSGGSDLVDVALPVTFGMVQALVIMWVTFDPLVYIMKGNAPTLSLRWVEVCVLVGMAIVTFAVMTAAQDY